MKKRTLIGMGLLLVAVIAALCLFMCRRAETYVYVLPADMKAVASVDVAALAKVTGWNADSLQAAGLAGPDGEAVGLDLSKKIYAFVSPEDYVGVTGVVDDAGLLQKFLQKKSEEGVCSAVREQRGFRWTTLSDRWLAAFDDDKWLVMGPAMGKEQDELRYKMLLYLRQDKAESGVGSPLFAELPQQTGPVTAVTRLDVVPQAYVPAKVDPQDVRMAFSLQLEDNRMALHIALLSDHPEIQKRCDEIKALFRPIRGDLAAYDLQRPLLWACVNLDGEKLVEQLRKNPSVRTALIMLNMAIDADMILKSIDGDVAVSVEGLDGNVSIPTRLTARLRNTDFLSHADDWKRPAGGRSDLAIEEQGNDRFYLSMGDYSFYLGVKDRSLYVTNNERLASSALVAPPEGQLASLRKEMEGCYWYVTIDLTRLSQQGSTWLPVAAEGKDAQYVRNLQDICTRLVIKSVEPQQLDVELYAPDGTDLTKELLKWIR